METRVKGQPFNIPEYGNEVRGCLVRIEEGIVGKTYVIKTDDGRYVACRNCEPVLTQLA